MKKKLALALDDLRVESFATDAAGGVRGTVRAAQEEQTIEYTACRSCPTCGNPPATTTELKAVTFLDCPTSPAQCCY